VRLGQGSLQAADRHGKDPPSSEFPTPAGFSDGAARPGSRTLFAVSFPNSCNPKQLCDLPEKEVFLARQMLLLPSFA
jgi:hypothetical protein